MADVKNVNLATLVTKHELSDAESNTLKYRGFKTDSVPHFELIEWDPREILD